MGITIFYKGQCKPSVNIPALIDEMEDFANHLGWKSQRLHTLELRGIILTPHPQSEPVWLCFNQQGRLVMPGMLEMEGPDTEMAHQLFTKTQFAGMDVHIAIVRLLHYINEHYMAQMEVLDEGHYWQSGDQALLRRTFEKNDVALNRFGSLLSSFPVEAGETAGELASRLEGWLLHR